MSPPSPSQAKSLTPRQYDKLLRELQKLLTEGRQRAEAAVAQQLVRTYHAVGERLLQQKLTGKAGYGTATVQRLADDLDVPVRTLQRAVLFARVYPQGPPELQLRWAHYRELLRLPSAEQREWYAAQAAAQGWSAPKLLQAIREQQYRDRTEPQLEAPSPTGSESVRRPDQATYVYRATIERVVDGDTLLALIDLGFQVLRRQRLRLAGIDTPPRETAKGAKARARVEQALAEVDFVMIKTEKIDLYGRYIAHVFYEPGETDKQRIFAEGRHLNQLLVDEGLAEAL